MALQFGSAPGANELESFGRKKSSPRRAARDGMKQELYESRGKIGIKE
jgi:hypothetical protein